MNHRYLSILVLFVFLLGAAPALAQTIAVGYQSVWRYEDTGTDLGTAWRDAGYNHTGWSQGPGILGYGEPYINTTVSDGGNPNNVNRTTYFRKYFTLADSANSIVTLFLKANFDDGMVAYINGQEAVRASMPAGAINYSTLASSHEGGGYETYYISSSIADLNDTLNMLAVEVHQSSASSSDLVWDAQLGYSTLPAFLTRGPYLQIATDTSAILRWRTDTATDSRVSYGSAPGSLINDVDDAALVTEHEVLITGLTAETKYYYSVGTTTDVLEGDDADHWFETHPPRGSIRPVRVWVIGDSGTKDHKARAVWNAYEAYPDADDTDVWLMLGDNAYGTGTDQEYQAAVFDMYTSRLWKSFLWPTRGNHDVTAGGGVFDYYDIFSMPTIGQAGGVASGTEAYYSFDYANIHFICLDSEGTNRLPNGGMANWLRQDLSATNQPWIIAYWHHPPYTKGSHDSDKSTDSGRRLMDMREYMLPILDSAGVDLVFGGHSHAYERSVLLNGHYGLSTTLLPSMIIDGGDGSPDGDGPYVKPTTVKGAFEGCIYTVAGSSGKVSQSGALNHPAMSTSHRSLGSVVIDVNDMQLDMAFIDTLGTVLDSLTIWKGVDTGIETAGDSRPATQLALGPVDPNPFTEQAAIRFLLPKRTDVRLAIYDVSGRLVRSLVDESMSGGEHAVIWDGRNDSGRFASSGVYFSVLEADRETRARKINLIR